MPTSFPPFSWQGHASQHKGLHTGKWVHERQQEAAPGLLQLPPANRVRQLWLWCRIQGRTMWLLTGITASWAAIAIHLQPLLPDRQALTAFGKQAFKKPGRRSAPVWAGHAATAVSDFSGQV